MEESMRLFAILSPILAVFFMTVPGHAQSVPLLQSAETIDKGNFKLVLAPAYVLGKNGADGEFGVVGRFGYGFASRFDAELKTAVYENETYLGGDAEVWLVHDAGVNVSMTGGLHYVFGGGNRSDTWAVELTPLASLPLRPGFDLYAGFNAAFEKIQDAPPGSDDSFTRTHLIPGFEYSLSKDADLAGEFGIGLNDNSAHYVSAGIEFYLR
jgi:hypothetical protein